ncbi:MAG: hypothetical protein FJ088_08365 [Deltaproteobacteria bacterium]|nr:hypothetical protein [Deltaproteobacteria bacterium]
MVFRLVRQMKVGNIAAAIIALLFLIFSMCDRPYPEHPPQPVETDGGYGKSFVFFGQSQLQFKAEKDAISKPETESDVEEQVTTTEW